MLNSSVVVFLFVCIVGLGAHQDHKEATETPVRSAARINRR